MARTPAPPAGGGLQYHDNRGSSTLNFASGTSSGVQGDSAKVNSMKNVSQAAGPFPASRAGAPCKRCPQPLQPAHTCLVVAAQLDCSLYWPSISSAASLKQRLQPQPTHPDPFTPTRRSRPCSPACCRRTVG